MAKKYQVFISSTFEDLKEQRDAVVKAVLQLGHLPVGMEMFNAGDQTQWETIKSYIDSSDYYLVVLAHRYGSVDANGISYTEKEYDYAGEQGIPRLGFVIEKDATWPADQVEAKAKKKLDAFKSKVGSTRVINFWNTTDKLIHHVTFSLSHEIARNPRTGWVRATETPSGSHLAALAGSAIQGTSDDFCYYWPIIHPIVRGIAKPRFENHLYADAVESTFKEITHLIKEAYKRVSGDTRERDGDDLMRKAFSCERDNNTHVLLRAPILYLTDRDLATDSGYSVQLGYMNLFAGAVRGIRNPKAHANIVIDAGEAWEMIVLGSHLMRMWDRGQQYARSLSA
ncbi:DUF4062 domain-containing protein [uncultured Hymenobacter sp.]|uniref:DUF4062 domain-containing protein n=1 Tax=uncultured Hymenobacter sp. TaxID=170016 RepID=UPI0035CC442A